MHRLHLNQKKSTIIDLLYWYTAFVEVAPSDSCMTVAWCSTGDQTAHLWWRLQHGALFTKHPPQLCVVMIGTNDLGLASCGLGEPGIQAAVAGVFSRYFPGCMVAPLSIMDVVTQGMQGLQQHAGQGLMLEACNSMLRCADG